MGMEHGGNPREGTLVSHGFLNGSLGERRSKSSPSISRTINVNPRTTDHDYGFSFLSFSFLFFFFFCHYEAFKRLYRKKKSNDHCILCFNFFSNFGGELKYIYLVVINVCALFCVQPFSVDVISCTRLCISTLGICYSSRLLYPGYWTFILFAKWCYYMLVQTCWYGLLCLLDDPFGVYSKGKITRSNGMNRFGALVTYFLTYSLGGLICLQLP